MTKVRWGVLSTARIGIEKVIPAMQQGRYSEIAGIASRDAKKAIDVATKLNIPKAYGSYTELLADNDLDAVYISLPNHLHVEWAVKSLQAGKHVLCEKPIGMNLKEVEYLTSVARQFPQLKIMEAFMYRFHPQWKTVRALVDDGTIGELTFLHSIFCYYNINPTDIRNKKDIGGGALLDIGCYCVSLARFLFGNEPEHVYGYIDTDPQLGIDRLTSGILEFTNGRSTFTCSTQTHPHQHATLLGTKGRIEIDFPFNPPHDRTTSIRLQSDASEKIIEFAPVNQYTLQGDAFSLAILEKKEVPTPLRDAAANMKVIDDLFAHYRS